MSRISSAVNWSMVVSAGRTDVAVTGAGGSAAIALAVGAAGASDVGRWRSDKFKGDTRGNAPSVSVASSAGCRIAAGVGAAMSTVSVDGSTSTEPSLSDGYMTGAIMVGRVVSAVAC